MGLKRVLSGSWFIRLIMISWIICAVAIYVLFKNMELIVHGQLYYYGLISSPDWADPYRIYTWLIYISLIVPTTLSGIALVSSFFKVEKLPQKRSAVPQRTRPPQGNVKMEPRPTFTEVIQRDETGNSNGISCPQCKKVFREALVMLEFRNGNNRMVSVCPYCNYVLGYTSEERDTNGKLPK